MRHFVFWLAAAAVVAGAQERSGQELYSAYCAGCHGATGEGGSGPDLTSVAFHRAVSDEAMLRVIGQGVAGTAMPGFGGQIDGRGQRALVAHLRGLASKAMQPFTTVEAPVIDVTPARLLTPEEDNWLMYGRDYGNQRFSPLRQITPENVKRLVPVWSFQPGVADGLQATPLYIDGVLYLSTSWNHVFAIDARTGAEIWHYRRRLPEKLTYCCGPVNRGVAAGGGTIYLTTLDAHLVALDARTGRVKWDVEMGKPAENLSATAPPLVVGNKVVAGIAGGDYPSRGFLDAYEAATGKRLWRFYTIPGEGEAGRESWEGESWKTGGAATWMNGSYDAELNLIYWGVGNPYPDFDRDARRGDNLYSDSVVALDAETGKLRWHYQYTPGDPWDYDGVNELVFVDDLRHEGKPYKALVHADRNGHFYALERATGRFLYAKPFVRVTWARGFDGKGRPMINPAAYPTVEGVEVCPGGGGAKEWNAMAYSPVTRLAYVPVIENCAVFLNYGVEAKRKGLPAGASGFRYLPGQASGKVMAIGVDTGERVWEMPLRTPNGAGMLVTAGGLVFTGDAEGNFRALEASNGAELWAYQTGSGIRAAPISYRLDGVQYVAIASGMSGAVRGFTGAGAPWMANWRSGGTLYVFRLFEEGASTAFHGGAKK
jgi:alcohol dehydrogenase (cytochrome c)